jgi:hypothetical protein
MTGIVSASPPNYGGPSTNQPYSLTPTGAVRVQVMSQGASGAALLTDNVATTAANSILITATVAGAVTLTLADGSTVVVNPQVGDNIYPFQVTKAHVTAGTITAMYNLTTS